MSYFHTSNDHVLIVMRAALVCYMQCQNLSVPFPHVVRLPGQGMAPALALMALAQQGQIRPKGCCCKPKGCSERADESHPGAAGDHRRVAGWGAGVPQGACQR